MAKKIIAAWSAFAAHRQQQRFAAQRASTRAESGELSNRMVDFSGYVHIPS